MNDIFHNYTTEMTTNSLTEPAPVESIKKFVFSTKGEDEKIEIVIPEVSKCREASEIL